ncbi:MAG: alanyl-tRNA editing protein [Spirochaetaceae bacterium]|jgi:alanyl-tRNA synthetase|nr:alanyl-tRNA editing protein [Spirochaetaceae bacterium]
MRTEIRYYHQPVESAGTAEIREIRPFGQGAAAVLLDRTIFYPEGGGQSGDRGSINRAALLDVQESSGEILHIVSAESAAGLAPGPAELVLDAPRRRDFTVHHTAQHLLSGLTLKLTGKPTLSMHLGEEVCTIDVDSSEFPESAQVEIEEAVADAIEENQPVITHLCPPERVEDFPLRKIPPKGEDVIRVIEIQGKDFSPCCGTHLQSTGQIGMLRIVKVEKYKGKTRVYFIAGRRVLRDSRLLGRNADSVSRALKVPVGEIGKGMEAFLEKTAAVERTLKAREEELAGYKAENLIRGRSGMIIADLPDCDFAETLRIGRSAQKLTQAVILLAVPKERKFAAFCSAENADLPKLLAEPLARVNGKGGGSASFFQGLFPDQTGLTSFLDFFSSLV